MPLSPNLNSLAVTALVTFLLFPAQYYVPDLYLGSYEPPPQPKQLLRLPIAVNGTNTWLPWLPVDVSSLDLFLTVSLILLALVTYVCNWIQRKLMERRLIKHKQYLQDCVERLRSWDVRQEQLDATIKMVENATSEYNMLLYLLLQHHHIGPVNGKPFSCCSC